MALLALACSLLWGTGDYLGGVVSRRRPAVVVVLVVQALGVLLVVTAAAVTGSLAVGAARGTAVAAGLAGAVALSAFYAALALGTMGVVAPIAATGVVVPVVVSWLRGERPGVAAGAGILLAGCGVVLSSTAERRGRGHLLAPALAVLAAAGFGSVLVLVDRAAAVPGATTLGILVTMRFSAAALLAVVVAARRLPLRLARTDLPVIGLAAVCDVVAVGVYALATQRATNLAVVAVLASLYPVVTALIARRLLAERLSRWQVAGVGAALAGVVLIAAGAAGAAG